MSRRRAAVKRKVIPDPKFNNAMLARFINKIMLDGKKSISQKILYQVVETIKEKTKAEDVVEVVTKAVDNVKPLLEVKSRRIGGATYQVPVEVASERREALAMRWLIQFARARKGVPMAKALADELLDAYNSRGAAVKKKEDTHKMAEANKAFAHYRW